jgi:hypothetical protein
MGDTKDLCEWKNRPAPEWFLNEEVFI